MIMNFNDNKPIFKQIADYIIDKIASGKWSEGDRILSVRELASDIEVNPNTVARTYGKLNDMNIISNRRGIGFFINEGAKNRATAILKNEFIKNELPDFFYKMTLLDLNIDQLKQYYNGQENEEK